jgi:hypothetical protein
MGGSVRVLLVSWIRSSCRSLLVDHEALLRFFV